MTTAIENASTIKSFLALPAEAMPSAQYVGEPGLLHPWSAIRCAVSRDAERQDLARGCGRLRLCADRPEWRDGVVIEI